MQVVLRPIRDMGAVRYSASYWALNDVFAPMKPDTVKLPNQSYGTLWGTTFSSHSRDGFRCNPQTTWATPGTRHSHQEGRRIERNPAQRC